MTGTDGRGSPCCRVLCSSNGNNCRVPVMPHEPAVFLHETRQALFFLVKNLIPRLQNKDTPALCIQALEHHVGAGQLQFLRQNGLVHILAKVWQVLELAIADVIPVKLKAQGTQASFFPV